MKTIFQKKKNSSTHQLHTQEQLLEVGPHSATTLQGPFLLLLLLLLVMPSIELRAYPAINTPTSWDDQQSRYPSWKLLCGTSIINPLVNLNTVSACYVPKKKQFKRILTLINCFIHQKLIFGVPMKSSDYFLQNCTLSSLISKSRIH